MNQLTDNKIIKNEIVRDALIPKVFTLTSPRQIYNGEMRGSSLTIGKENKNKMRLLAKNPSIMGDSPDEGKGNRIKSSKI